MEISKDVYNLVKHAVKDALVHSDYELEVKHQSRLSRDAFIRALQYYRSKGFKQIDHPDTLDIFLDYKGQQYRVSLKGKENIQKYCAKNRIDENMVSEMITKKWVQGFKPIIVNDYSFKIDLKHEIKVNDMRKVEILLASGSLPKGFRMKKRYSFVDKKSQLRYDLTVVKRSQNVGNEFLSHPRFTTFMSQESFEIEVEMMQGDKLTPDEITDNLLKSGIYIYAVTNGIENIISKNQKLTVLKEYLKLCGKEDATLETMMAKPRSFFCGPQPITLELENIAQDYPMGTSSILEDYTVTEKADGERCLMFVNKVGQCHIINNKLEVFALGVSTPEIASSLFDGEFITRSAEGDAIRVYAMFDVYYYKGKDTQSLPLVSADDSPSRLTLMQEVLKHKKAFKDMTVHVKEFHHGPSIFEASKKVMDMINADMFAYRIDGMIFTPKYLPVGSLYKQGAPALQGTWTKVFKWKPPVENTIDMLVKANNMTVVDNSIAKVFILNVGYKPSQWEPIKPKEYLEKGLKPDSRYKVIPFQPSSILDRDFSMFYGNVCKNGDEIMDQSIVEFAYIKDEKLPYPQRWVPLRVRKDKTMPNDYGTAMNVWRSIEMPVTEDMIVGDTPVKMSDLPQEDVYYKRNISRDKFASRNLMDFHNYWNKWHFLMKKYSEGKKSLFDIACGKGGDLKRWIESGLTTVYGIDVSRDNIENPSDGIYARLSQKNGLPLGSKYMFATMDASVELDEPYISKLDEDNKHVGNLLMSHGPFEMVSCQFALHYFFKDEMTLEAFASNVNRFLAPNGYFIGSCLDGTVIKKKLADVGQRESLSGKMDDRVLWNIRKEYADNGPISYGDKIKVFMESIGAEIPEYLVDMSLLTEKLAQYNIVPVEIRSFQDTYKEVMSMDQSKQNAYYLDACKNLSDTEKEYSFMNMLFAFKKEEASAATTPPPAPPKKKVVKKKTKDT